MQALTAPYLPVPLQPILAGQLPAVVFQHHLRTGEFFVAPQRVVMEWVGHADSAMVRHYFHLHDEEAQRRMNGLNLLGGAAGRSDGSGLKALTEDATPAGERRVQSGKIFCD